MRICIIAEGSYPHVIGGVSSWINNLIKACPEHEYIIYSIGADYKMKGKYKYTLPDNVVAVHEIFLNDIKFSNKRKGRRYKMTPTQKLAIKELLMGADFSWEEVFDLFISKPFDLASEFFMSKDFFDIVDSVYREVYPYTPFTEFIWSVRSMYLSFFFILMQEIPVADVYHSVSTGYAGIIASYAKYQYGKPFILSEHGIYTREREEEIIKAKWVKGYYKDLWIKYFYHFSRCAYRFADAVTTLFSVNRGLQIELGCDESKILMIPNGVRLERFEDLPQKEDESRLLIGAVVRVVPIKDLMTMIHSFKTVKDQLPEAEFFIMGPDDEDEEYYQNCIDLVKYIDLKDVTFTGTIDIRDYLGKMDVLVLTSISEGQPLAVMEGMAAKKPFVTTNVGDCKGLLLGVEDHYGPAGFVEYVMDSNGIAESIIKLCKNKSLREEMGLNGYYRIADKYLFQTYIDQYKELYSRFE